MNSNLVTKLRGLFMLLMARDWLLYTQGKVLGNVSDAAHPLLRQQADILDRIK